MEALSFDNILGEQDIENLFSDEPSVETEEATAGEPAAEERNNETFETTEVDPESLFDDEEEEKKEEPEEQPESVGSEKTEVKEQGDAATEEGSDTSPQNFYSSIANALAVDGIFPNLDEEMIEKVDTAEGLSDLIEAEVNARLDEKQQRISKALENGVEATDIRKYENTLQYISTITEDNITEESEKGEQLRRNLIFQDYLNKGYSQEKAQKMTERSISAGNDIEDAKDALQSNKEYFQSQYDNLLGEAQRRADAEKAERAKQSEKLRKSILEDKHLMGDMEIDKSLRKKAFDAISKPVYKDPETGEYLTALQQYEQENRADFLKNVGLLFALTNGFKDFKTFAKGEVKKEMKKGLRELEQTLNNTRRTPSGSLKMVTTAKEDPDTYFSKSLTFDL